MFERDTEQVGSLTFERKKPLAQRIVGLGADAPGIDVPERKIGNAASRDGALLDGEAAMATHRALMGHYRRELSRQESARAEMAMDEDFVDHIHWTQEELTELLVRGQMPTVFNITAISIFWVLGSERRSPMDWKLLARTAEGIKHAEFKTELMKHVSDVNNSTFVQSQAFRDAVVAGLGWLETGESAKGSGTIVYDRAESWRNMLWDSTANEWDMSDARYMFRTKWVDTDIASAMFPNRSGLIERGSQRRLYSAEFSGMSGYDSAGDQPMDSAEEAHFETSGLVGMSEFSSRNRVRLIEAWFQKPATVPIMKGGQFHGEIFDEWSPGHWADIKRDRASLVAQPRQVMHVAIMTQDGLLAYRQTPYRHNRFPFTPVWGNRRARDKMPYGMVRGMRDINRDLNKRASKSLHILSSTRAFVQKGSVADIEMFRDEVARPDAVIVYEEGSPPPVVDVDQNLAQGHMNLMQNDLMMIREASGVTGENLGQHTNAQSGKAIIAKQEQGALTTSHYFDNLRFARKAHGEKIVVNIEQFYTSEVQFRITNSSGNPEFRTINSNPIEGDDAIALTRADFILNEEDWRASVRQANAELLLDLFSKLAATAPQIVIGSLDLLVKSMDVPHRDELVRRIRSMTGAVDPDEDPNNPDPEAQKIKAAKDEEAAMLQRAKEAEVSLAEAKAREMGAKADKLGLEMLAAKRDLTGAEIQRLRDAVAAAIEIAGAAAFAEIADQVLAQAENKAAAGPSTAPAQIPAPGPEMPMPAIAPEPVPANRGEQL